MSRWFRWYEQTCEDGKFRVVARLSRVTVRDVIALWAFMLEDAAHLEHRGVCMRDEDFMAGVLDFDDGVVERILESMESAGLISVGHGAITICNWGKRQFEGDADPTAAERQRRKRERDKTVSNGPVTRDSRPPDTDTDTDTEERKISRKAPRRISYPPRYLVFWEGYPTDALMSKSEAFTEWQKLSSEDQEAAIASLPAFKAATAKLGPDHRVIHACRFLSKRRFDAFAEVAAKIHTATEAASSRVYVKYGTDAGDAWEDYHRQVLKRPPPRDQAGGWWFDTEYPPENVQRETSEAA